MAAISLLDLTPLRAPSTADRQQLIHAVSQHIAAQQQAFLHQQQQQQARRQRITGPTSKAIRTGRSSLSTRSTTVALTRPLVALKYQVWGMQYASQSSQKLESVEAVTHFFQQEGVDGRLLILGEPGTGKSQTLYGLGAHLLAAIRPSDPVPVLLDVTGWQGADLRTWILDQLWIHYRVARSCARHWLDSGQLALLLDGFDTLPVAAQRTCAKMIDTLMRGNVDQSVALCCQRQALERTGIAFTYFNSGVHIIPFAAQQVKDYVVGLDRPDIWKAIKASKSLQHLARFPLMLNFLIESYDGAAAANRGELVQQYVTAQLSETLDPSASAQRSPRLRRLLSWLARYQGERERTFAIDGLNPSWLPASQRLLYRLLLALTLMLIIGGISGSPLLGLAIGIVASQVDVDHFFHYRLSLASLHGGAWRLPLVTAIAMGVVLAIPLGIVIGGTVARFGQGATAGLYSAASGVTLGFLGGLLFQSWGGIQHAIQFRRRFNQDTISALINGLLLTLVYGILLSVIVTLSVMVSAQPMEQLLDPGGLRVLVAIATGLVLWASYCLQHVILRILLVMGSQGALPFNPVPYLNEAVERKLLQRVGGGYRFLHEQIREQFAQNP